MGKTKYIVPVLMLAFMASVASALECSDYTPAGTDCNFYVATSTSGALCTVSVWDENGGLLTEWASIDNNKIGANIKYFTVVGKTQGRYDLCANCVGDSNNLACESITVYNAPGIGNDKQPGYVLFTLFWNFVGNIGRWISGILA